MQRFFKSLFLALFLLMGLNCGGSGSSHSVLSISLKENTQFPALVVSESTVTAYFTITNNSPRTYTTINIYSLPDNVTAVTSNGTYADTCSSPATITSHGSCTLQLTVSGAVPSSSRIVACLNSVISCYQAITPSAIRELSSLAVSPSTLEIEVDSTQQFTATGTFADDTTDDISSLVTWTSSDTDALSISSAGLATALAAGTGTVTATYDILSSNAATFSSGTTSLVLSAITITPNNPMMSLNSETLQFTAEATYEDASSADITSSVTWHSSDSSVGTLDSSGLFTALTSGSTDITASLNGITSNASNLFITP